MAEKNFFDLLKEKMAALHPSTRHQDADWAALSERLDEALPQQPKQRRRTGVLPILLLLALLSSNIFWWRMHRKSQTALQGIEMQLTTLQKPAADHSSGTTKTCTDTVWRVVYVDRPVFGQLFSSIRPEGYEIKFKKQQLNELSSHLTENSPTISTASDKIPFETGHFGPEKRDTSGETAGLETLETLRPWYFNEPNQQVFQLPEFLAAPVQVQQKPAHPLVPALVNALKPKYGKIGIIGGWVHPVNPDLMHQVGFETGAQGIVGFSRHWSLVFEYTYGQLHYESVSPTAILGSPHLELPSSEYKFTHLNIKGQAYRRYGFGARYTFSPTGKACPYIGLNWSSQTLMPYKVDYEIQHEPTNTVLQDIFIHDRRLRYKNLLRLGVGLEIPLSHQFDLSAEGYYMRQWKKNNKDVLDLTGIRLGVNWKF